MGNIWALSPAAARAAIGLAALVVAGQTSSVAHASPSFDCTKAGTPTEHAICASPVLADLDTALAAAYSAAHTGQSEAVRRVVRNAQRTWIGRRNACGGDAACLEGEMRARLAVLAGSASPVASVAPAASPSFDCDRAGTATERAICASPALSGLDRALAAAYGAARDGKSEGVRDAIRANQVQWLGQRNACGDDAACLADRMSARLAALRGGQGASPGLSGIYCARGGADSLVVETRGDAADFALSSWQTNGHHCGTPMLTGIRTGDAFVETDGGCTLRLWQEGGAVVLEAAPFDACQRQYCGARAAMGRFEFPAEARRPLPVPARDVNLVEQAACP